MQKITTEVDGVFKNGTPGSVRGTKLNAEWFNAVQDELVNFIEMTGGTLDANNGHQVLDALYAVLTAQSGLYITKLVISSQLMRTDLVNGRLTFSGGGHTVKIGADGISIDGLSLTENNRASGDDKYLVIGGGLELSTKLIVGGTIEVGGNGFFEGEVDTPNLKTDQINPSTSGNQIQVNSSVRVNGTFHVGSSQSPSSATIGGNLSAGGNCNIGGELDVLGDADLKGDALVRGKFVAVGDCDLGGTHIGSGDNNADLNVYGDSVVRGNTTLGGGLNARGIVVDASNASTLKAQAAAAFPGLNTCVIVFKMSANVTYYVNDHANDTVRSDFVAALSFYRESPTSDLIRMFPQVTNG